MELVSLLPVSRRAIELLKARNPKLIQRPIVVHGSMGNYIRNAWILPEEADKENPRAAQFDLFDQGQPAKRKEALAETDEKELANEKADAESLRRMIKESKKPSSDIAVLDQRIKEAHDLGMIMQDMKEDRERDAAYQVRVDAAEKYRGGDYEKYLVAYDAVALDSQKIGNTIQHSKSPEKIAAFAVQYVNSLGNAVPMSFAEKVEKLAKEYGKKIDTTETKKAILDSFRYSLAKAFRGS